MASSYSEIEQLIARYDRSVGGLEDDALQRISDSLDAAYRNLEQELRRIYPQWQSQGSLYAAQRRLLLMSELGDLLSIVRPDQDAEYQQLFEELLQTAHLTGATLADELVNIVEPSYPLQEFSTIPIEAAVLQARDGVERLKRYDQEFRTAASAIVEESLIQGWGASKVAQNLRSQLGVTKSKAETLARTEVMSALNDAAQQRYEENNVEWFEWVATPSERLCAFCAGRDGNFYQVGTVRLPSHPRCRCIVSPVKAKWLEKGLIDTEAIAQRRADGIAELRKRGIEPNYGPTYWEKKAGAEAAPEPVWKPETKTERKQAPAARPAAAGETGGTAKDGPHMALIERGKKALSAKNRAALESMGENEALRNLRSQLEEADAAFDQLFDDVGPAAFKAPEGLRVAELKKQVNEAEAAATADGIKAMTQVRGQLLKGMTKAEGDSFADDRPISPAAARKYQGGKAALKEDLAEFWRMTGGRGVFSFEGIIYDEPRAYMLGGEVNIGIEESRAAHKKILFHELGHILEGDRSVAAQMRSWVEARATSSKIEKLSQITGNDGYEDDEVAHRDNWVSPYIGKHYGDGETEALSVGLEYFTSPEDMLELYRRDEEHFWLVVGALRTGKYDD